MKTTFIAVLLMTTFLPWPFLTAAAEPVPLRVGLVNPWRLPPSNQLPPNDRPVLDEINIEAFQNEFLARTVSIANPGDHQVTMRAILSPDLVNLFAGLQTEPTANHVQMYQPLEISLGGRATYDVLPKLRPDNTFAVPAQGNSIVWLNITTHGLEPGLWSGYIELLPLVDQKLSIRIPLSLKVLPAPMHPGPRPFAVPWVANPYQGFIPFQKEHDENVLIQDLKDYQVNTFLLPAVGHNTMEYDAEGRAVSAPDLSAYDRWIEDFGTSGVIYVISLFYEYLPAELGGGGQWGEIEEENFAWYVGHVRRYFARQGLGVKDFAWYVDDEPTTVERAQRTVNFGRLLQAADPEQQIFVTVYDRVEPEALDDMAPYINLWVPSLDMTQEQHDFMNRQEGRVLSYAVRTRTDDAYRHIRGLGIQAFRRGYEGVGIWSYGSTAGSYGTSLWHDDEGLSKYSLNYNGGIEPVGSIRKEGWRMGIQDYRYCEWLTALAEAVDNPDLAERARSMLAELIDNWQPPGAIDRYIDTMRPLIMEMLVSLGRVDETQWRAVDALSVPALLTYNGGTYAPRRINTGGSYSYSTTLPSQYGESCGVNDGPIYFNGSDASDGPQAENKRDGNLTDGRLGYPGDYAIHWWPPATVSITFDFKNRYEMSHGFFIGDQRAITAMVSENGADGTWQEAGSIAAEWPEEQVGMDGAAFIDLRGLTGRYVRLDISTGGQSLRLGQVRIYGWDR